MPAAYAIRFSASVTLICSASASTRWASAPHHHNAVGVGDDDVTREYDDSGDCDWLLQPAGAALVGSSRDRAGEHRHPALGEAVRITHCCVDDETADTHRLGADADQVSDECPSRISQPIDDEDVAGLREIEGQQPGTAVGCGKKMTDPSPWRLCHCQLLVVGGSSALRALRR
jgi:hypothetical protein